MATPEKVQAVQKGSSFDEIFLIRMKDGKEVGNMFKINRVTFDAAYKHKTAKPDGTSDQPVFAVKKKNLKPIKRKK